MARPPVRSPTAPGMLGGYRLEPELLYLPTKGNDRGRCRPRQCRKPHVVYSELWTPQIYPAPKGLEGLAAGRLLR